MKPAREPASSRPKPHESCPFAAPCGPRRKKNDRRQRSAFPSETRAFDSRAQGFSPPLARQRSSCPPPSPNLVRTHPIENYQALRDSAPCLSRAATLPKATKLELGRGAHLKTPSSANHTAAASQPTGRIAKADSWLHLSRVSPALHPPERPSHTHTPKPGFGGRAHEYTSRGHTGGRSHRISHTPFCGVRALMFLARRIQPFFSLVDRGVDFCVLTI